MREGPTVEKKRRPAPTHGGELPCVEVLSGQLAGRIYALQTGDNVIGRHVRLRVPLDDEGVSRRHAKIVVGSDGLVNLVDLQSTNGTFLNGAPVDVAILREGDRIAIGPDVELRFSYQPPPRPEPEAAALALSERELQIALLVAEGLTNAEIGRELAISPHTVMTHLSNVYQRHGLRSRAELTKLVVRARSGA